MVAAVSGDRSLKPNGVSGVIIDTYPYTEETCSFEYMSFEEEDELASAQLRGPRENESIQFDFEQTSS
jgi:hypothetical protein